MFDNISSQLNALGSVKVTGVDSDFYAKYLIVPNVNNAWPPTRAPGTWPARAGSEETGFESRR